MQSCNYFCTNLIWFICFPIYFPDHFMGKRWGKSGNSVRLYFFAHPLEWRTTAPCFLEPILSVVTSSQKVAPPLSDALTLPPAMFLWLSCSLLLILSSLETQKPTSSLVLSLPLSLCCFLCSPPWILQHLWMWYFFLPALTPLEHSASAWLEVHLYADDPPTYTPSSMLLLDFRLVCTSTCLKPLPGCLQYLKLVTSTTELLTAHRSPHPPPTCPQQDKSAIWLLLIILALKLRKAM